MENESAACAGSTAEVKTKEEEDVPSTSKVSEKGIQSKVTFEVLFDFEKANRQITAQGSQRILNALEDEPYLQKIKNGLPKVFLDPADGSKIKGEPNIGSPCSSIAGGKFKARLHTKLSAGQSLSVYNDDELKSTNRCKFYIDVSGQRSKATWITKMDPRKYHFDILLIDCLPNDTLLSALLRDGRIDVSKVKCCTLLYKQRRYDTGTIVKLTDNVNFYLHKTFVCTVTSGPQVSEDDWEKALHGKVPVDDTVVSNLVDDTVVSSPTTEGTKSKTESPTPEAVGNSSSWENGIKEKLYANWQALVADLFKLDLEPKTSAKGRNETIRRNKLDTFAEPFVQEYHNINQGTLVVQMENLINYSKSVGGFFKDGNFHGTCFRVGPKFALTNKHVTDLAGLSIGSCSGAHVDFNYLRTRSKDVINVKEVNYSSQELDFSILELDIPENKESLPGLEYLMGPTNKGSTSAVTIIGHPRGDPKKLDVSRPIVSCDRNEAAYYLKFNPKPRGDADYSKLKDPRRATYRTNFDHGSSGSPGFDQNGKLIVMHTCGYPLYKGSSSVVEQGIKITAIFDDLEQNEPDLFHAIFPQQPMDCS